MNTQHAMQPLLSVRAQIAVAVASLAIIASGVAFAGHASHEATETAQAAIYPGVVRVVLPQVEVVGRRITAGSVADAACAAPART